MKIWQLPFGANFTSSDKASFKVWAPYCNKVQLRLPSRTVEMSKDLDGYFHANEKIVSSNPRYRFYPDTINFETEGLPDPASRYQPLGVHGSSEIINPNDFKWTDKKWTGLNHEELIIYELHVGTFTKKGDFLSIIKKLPYLKNELGITCIELMPIAQFPGKFGWSYDGVGLFAPQNTYGYPKDLKALVNACHEYKIGVCLDVIYNHIGPEGNYLHLFGPYFSQKNSTNWGWAYNFDEEQNKKVREFIISNALYWIDEFHMDALRLDAASSMKDSSKKHILAELQEKVNEYENLSGRKILILPEDYGNSCTHILPIDKGGYGLSAKWNPDFEHALRVVLDGQRAGWYRDYKGVKSLAKTIKDAHVFDGSVSPAFRNEDLDPTKTFGTTAQGISGKHFIVYSQTHDTAGNHPLGLRLSSDYLSFPLLKTIAVTTLLSPYIPLMFMGEEFGAKTPFNFFVDFGDEHLKKGVIEGRKRDLQKFGWDNWDKAPDPCNIETLQKSKINWKELNNRENNNLLSLYKDLIEFRKTFLLPYVFDRENIEVKYNEGKKLITVKYDLKEKGELLITTSFLDKSQKIRLPFNVNKISIVLQTENEKYGGSLSDELANIDYTKQIHLPPQSSVIGWIRS